MPCFFPIAAAGRKHKYIFVRGENLYPLYLHDAPNRMTTHEVSRLIPSAWLKGTHTGHSISGMNGAFEKLWLFSLLKSKLRDNKSLKSLFEQRPIQWLRTSDWWHLGSL